MSKSYEVTGDFYSKRMAQQKSAFESYPPFPVDCMVELTNVCNHECLFCTNPRMKRKVAHLSLDLFKKFVFQAAKLGCKEMGFYSTGEPFITPNLHEFVSLAVEADIPYRYISTNGSLAIPARAQKVIDAGLNSIKFSINAATRETYKLIHGKDEFDLVLANLKWIFDYKQKTNADLRLLGSCVLTYPTKDEKELHKEIFGKYFEDILYVNASSQAGQAEMEAEIVSPSLAKTSYPPEGSLGPCFMLWKRVHLTAEGFLTLCCVDYENNLTYAHIDDDQDLMAHWHNCVITEMRQRHLKGELKGTLCHKCFYGGLAPYQPISNLYNPTIVPPNSKKAQHLQERLDIVSGQKKS